MSDGRLSESALHAALHPITVPNAGAGGWVADVLAVLAVALLVALLAAWIVETVFAQRRKPATAPKLSAQLVACRNLPEDAKRLSLYRLLRARSYTLRFTISPSHSMQSMSNR